MYLQVIPKAATKPYVKHYVAVALHNTCIYSSSSKSASTIHLTLCRHRSEADSTNQLLMASNCWAPRRIV